MKDICVYNCLCKFASLRTTDIYVCLNDIIFCDGDCSDRLMCIVLRFINLLKHKCLWTFCFCTDNNDSNTLDSLCGAGILMSQYCESSPGILGES